MKKYSSISLGQGHDSEPFIYKENGSDQVKFFHKEYKHKDYYGETITKEGLKLYHQIHNLISQENGRVKIDQFTLDGKKYQGIDIKTLPLYPDEIYEASIIETKEPIWITMPEYIGGKTFEDFDNDFEYDPNIGRMLTVFRLTSTIEYYIKKTVDKKLTENLKLTHRFRIPNMNEVNIKVVDSQDNYLHVIITDIAAQIFSSLFWDNKSIIDELRGKLLKNFL